MASSETTIWGIHAGRTVDADNLFRQKGYIALGWDELEDLSKPAPNRDAYKEAVSAAIPSYKPGAIPVAALRREFSRPVRFTAAVQRG